MYMTYQYSFAPYASFVSGRTPMDMIIMGLRLEDLDVGPTRLLMA